MWLHTYNLEKILFLLVTGHEVFYNAGPVLPEVRFQGEVTSDRYGSSARR